MFMSILTRLVPLATGGDFKTFFKRYGMIFLIGIVSTLDCIFVYMIAEKLPFRHDLTAERKYSVDPGLSRIMHKLDDQVQITYFVYARIQQFAELKLKMIDKLTEIKNASDGWVDFKVEEVDKEDAKLLQELNGHHMIQQLSAGGNEELSVSMFVSGMKITYKDIEAAYIPQMVYSEQLELELADQLLQLYYRDKPADKPLVAIDLPPSPQGRNIPGQPQRGNGYEWLTSETSRFQISPKKFDVKSIDMTQNNSIPEKSASLIMIRPKLMDERQKYEVEKYLAEGGHVLLIASPIRAFGSSNVEMTPFGLESYLKDCGISLGTNILCDRSHINVADQQQQQYVPVPYFIRIKPENIDQTSSLTRYMRGLVMPTATEIIFDDDVLKKNNLAATVLAKTTPQNWELKVNKYNGIEGEINPRDTASLNNPQKATFAVVKGQFPFPYEGKPVPDWPVAPADKDKDKEKDKDKDKPKSPANATVTKREGTLIICSAPEAFYEPYFDQQALAQLMVANVVLLTNLVENMSYGDDFIGMRTKQYETRTIAKLAPVEKEKERQIWKGVLIVAVPVLVMFFAIYRFLLRRASQLDYERKFAGTTGPSSFSA